MFYAWFGLFHSFHDVPKLYGVTDKAPGSDKKWKIFHLETISWLKDGLSKAKSNIYFLKYNQMAGNLPDFIRLKIQPQKV